MTQSFYIKQNTRNSNVSIYKNTKDLQMNIGVIATTILLILAFGMYAYVIKHNSQHEKK